MKNLHQRINEVMKKVETVFKDVDVAIGFNRSYSAVSHDGVAALLHRPMTDAGISFKVSVENCSITQQEKKNSKGDIVPEYRADVWVSCTFINIDDPTQRETCNGFSYAFDSSDKAFGKAMSMAVKYVLLKNFILESSDEEESREHEYKTQPKQIQPVVQKESVTNEVNNIKLLMSSLTTGFSDKDKIAKLKDMTGTISFSDLYSKSKSDLISIQNKISSELERNKKK
jgi:hypothetical protein